MADEAPAPEFAREIAPQPQPRESSGRFAEVASRPDPLFSVRMVEGDPETGDTRDGGDDPSLRAREREIADGRVDPRENRQDESSARRPPAQAERESGERRGPDGEESVDAAADAGHEGAEDREGEGDEEPGDEDDEGEKYEITVDGEPQTVSFNEMRNGYIREATFHSRLNKVKQHKQMVDQEGARVGQLRDLYIKGLAYLDDDLTQLSPPQPNWDEEFAKDPARAHQKQKEYQAYFGKLQSIRQNRAWAEQNRKEEYDRHSARYAVEQFSEFVAEHPKLFKDEPTIQRIVGGMRQMALNEGFEEHVIAGVYDKRMLNVLLKAYLHDRGDATVRPQAVAAPGNGKTLVPGSAKPIGNAGRRNVDEAQRKLARTGSMEDAAAYFHRVLR